MNSPLAIVLAAGKGTRMETDLPKVLVPALGRPMIEYVLEALHEAGIQRALVVVGYRSGEVRRVLTEPSGRRFPQITFVEQTEQLGTGHAVQVCRDCLAGHDGPVLIMTGDSPLVQRESLAALLERFQQDRPACILGTLHKEDPAGLGRIVRDRQGGFVAIVEEKDATAQQRDITEVNMSTYVFNGRDLLDSLAQIRNDNRQGEYYITDCPGILKDAGRAVLALAVLKSCEALSINSFEDLTVVEEEMRKLGYGSG